MRYILYIYHKGRYIYYDVGLLCLFIIHIHRAADWYFVIYGSKYDRNAVKAGVVVGRRMYISVYR